MCAMTDAPNAPIGPTTVQQDAQAAALAALMPLGGGVLIALGYAWLGAFGAVLAVAGVVWWAFWWRGKHGRFFPKDLRGGSVARLAVFVCVITVMLFASL